MDEIFKELKELINSFADDVLKYFNVYFYNLLCHKFFTHILLSYLWWCIWLKIYYQLFVLMNKNLKYNIEDK